MRSKGNFIYYELMSFKCLDDNNYGNFCIFYRWKGDLANIISEIRLNNLASIPIFGALEP